MRQVGCGFGFLGYRCLCFWVIMVLGIYGFNCIGLRRAFRCKLSFPLSVSVSQYPRGKMQIGESHLYESILYHYAPAFEALHF